MDELKNLVIQTLETNGILGQLRAQLRSCVFKVIDNQDQVEKSTASGFHWENPSAKKVLQTASGLICAELVRDFLEFYKLDYTLSIYMPEVNLTQQNAMSKEELSNKVGIKDGASVQKPLMMQLLEGFMSNEGPSSKSFEKVPDKKEEQKSFQ
jgi:FGFR1 oncogene partner